MNRKTIIAGLLACCLLLLLGIAGAESGSAEKLDAFLAQQAEGQKDPWVKAILLSGARDVAAEEGKVSFYLRGYDPDLKGLGSFAKAEDKVAWRKKAFENVSAYRLQLEVAYGEDGEVTKKSAAALITKVKNAASNAKGSLAKKEWTDAVTDLLFPSPTAAKKVEAASLTNADASFQAAIAARPELYPGETPSDWAPLFYVQRNWQYKVSQGPERIQLTWDGADPTKLLNQAYDQLTGYLAGKPGTERDAESSLPGLWRDALSEAAIKMKKGRLVPQAMTIDLDALIAGTAPEGYRDYIAAYTPAATFDQLVAGYRLMPEEAALPLPKNGAIHQAKKGRGVLIKVPKDGRNTYVQLRDADTFVIQAEAFITPGNNVTLKVPEGVYTVQYATGATWYGTTETFGATGNYLASDEFIVAKKKWNLTSEIEQEGILLHAIAAADMAPAEDKSIHVPGAIEAQIPLQEEYPATHPMIAGENGMTGLPASGEKYTPIVMVLDNAEDAYPHWGVTQADILFQVPNAGQGATKLMALYTDSYPAQAGPVRSGRSSMLPAALSFDAAIAFAGPPAISGTGGPADLMELTDQFRMSRTHRVYNLLSANGFGERVKGIGSHNLSCHIAEIHANLVEKGVEFEERPFLFTDEPRQTGAVANIVRVLHRGENAESGSNSASRAVFKYDPAKDYYTRTNSSGVYIDRDNGEVIPFANVIVLRVRMSYDRNYIYLNHHMTGSGTAEIFQNGRYVRGAWVRASETGRLVLVDEDGSELRLQRGKSFFVITNDITDVIYTE